MRIITHEIPHQGKDTKPLYKKAVVKKGERK